MPELSKAGRSIGDSTDSHTGSPSASSKGCSYGGSGATPASTRARCSSTVTESSSDRGTKAMGATLALLADAGPVVDASLRARFADDRVADHDDVAAERPVAVHPQAGCLPQARDAVGEAALEVGDEL